MTRDVKERTGATLIGRALVAIFGSLAAMVWFVNAIAAQGVDPTSTTSTVPPANGSPGNVSQEILVVVPQREPATTRPSTSVAPPTSPPPGGGGTSDFGQQGGATGNRQFGPLPQTGLGEGSRWLVAAGITLVAAGLFVRRASKRRRRDQPAVSGILE